MLLKCCIQYVNKCVWSGHRTGKGQFTFQSQRKAMPRNVQTTVQVCSFHMLVRLCSKSFKLGFSSKWRENFQMYKLGFKEAGEPEIKLWTSVGSEKKQGNSRKTSMSALWTTIKPFSVWVTINWIIFKDMGVQTTLPVSWEICTWVKKWQLELDME